MSDVLSAEERFPEKPPGELSNEQIIAKLKRWAAARERRNGPDGFGATGTALLDVAARRLATAEAQVEQLRSKRDAWHQRCLDAEDDVTFEQGRVEAAVRAGGCAADLAEALRAIATSPSKHPEYLRAIARMALVRFARAVSGQTAEKEEA